MTVPANGKRAATDFFVEGMAVLQESGFPALTAAGLCSRLGVTRGSFYHHFRNFDDFVDQLLVYWEEHYSRDLIARSRSRDLRAQIRMQADFAIGLPHAAEAALRAWGTINPRVASAQRRVDQLRHDGLAESLRRHGVSKQKADVYATIAIATLVGMQVTQHPFEPDALRAVYNELGAALGRNTVPA
ncbi:TetR family transcriptional regulator [Mycobacterium alsense]|uniref:TetR family transcriptional regulator n=1 Tax=Mycobacterium alsense TaxID=324058 RepID=A0AA42C0K0_9MYCO|nr:TetR/AcrR family transcriptional regulator [Mycobacterium alsense]MCV7380877.1 TetR/AcrR family transcriptional regulator [Mycobacterium alsense]OQZ90531.1 TetR family transcriptional regulator [Mycobacterium alsense]